ncbi:hypothetical protein AADZ90_012885 [Aestuariibius sp. 2305UL40-4]|uniref:hypothetical protein n=1 Tax=Aestuariibius violaceus TaxID=3234132 RepID=UPI00345E7C3D
MPTDGQTLEGSSFRGICSGGDWWAAYDVEKSLWFKRIIVFAALEDQSRGGLTVRGMDETDIVDDPDTFADSHGNFRGYVHSSDFSVLGKSLKPDVEKRFRR